MSSRIIVSLIFMLINFNDAARILAVFPMPAISHQSAFRPITQELARRGHHVTCITPNPAFPKHEAPENLREIDVHDITYGAWRELITKIPTNNVDDVYIQVKMIMKFITKFVEGQLLAPEVQELINNKNETFNLILTEHCTRLALVFSHLYQLPVIEISSFGAVYGGVFATIGAPTHPVLYPACLQQRLFNMTIYEKISTIYNYYKTSDIMNEHEVEENAMITKTLGDKLGVTPSVSEMKKNVVMTFLNVHPVWEDHRPVPPSVIYLGGVHQKPEKKLPEEYKSYLDSSEHGVIYFSLGTSVQASLVLADRVQIILKVFAKLPYDILWKYDKDFLPGKPSNVRIEKWVPQADLLRHPKVKLFIMQGGLQSTDEAITAGVPLVTIPILGDQWHNAERHVHHKIGVKLNLESLTEEIFKDAIDTVISDKSYRRNIEKLRNEMNDEPQRPVERAVWWIEHVLRHGGKHLKSPAANMPWTQYFEIELVVLVLFILISGVMVIIYSVYTLRRYVR